VIAYENRLRPWWYRTRELSLQWRSSSAEFEFVSVPGGFCAEGGWWRSKGGDDSTFAPHGCKHGGVWTVSEWIGAFREGLTYAAFPAGVTTMGDGALCRCRSLTWLGIASTVTTIGRSAVRGCSRLMQPDLRSVRNWRRYPPCHCGDERASDPLRPERRDALRRSHDALERRRGSRPQPRLRRVGELSTKSPCKVAGRP
jgi:hypothetical protein